VFHTSHAKFLLHWETANSIMFSWTLCRMNGSGKFKMGLEVDMEKRLSLNTLNSNAILTAIPMFSGLAIPVGMYPYCTTKLGGNRKWKIQDGGLHPWNAYISAPRRASNAMSTAIPMFWGRPCQWDMYLYHMTKLGGNRKWKIQDGGLHLWNVYISAIRLKRIWYHAQVLQRVHSITFWTWN